MTKSRSDDPKIRIMRGAQTNSNYSHGMGGLKKSPAKAPKKVSLPKVAALKLDPERE